MEPDLRIEWDEVCANPADCEKLVKLALLRIYPDGEVIDGRGGHGGREFQVRTSSSLIIYEAKSFTGRVSRRNPNRQRQVEESLNSAARNQPDAWHLVVPIDHNPAELGWFDQLRAGDYPFVGRWHGQMAGGTARATPRSGPLRHAGQAAGVRAPVQTRNRVAH